MKTITHTEMHRIIELLTDDNALKYSLIECHAKDILLKNDVYILDYDYLVKNLPIDALLILNKKGIIEALEWVSVNLQRYLYIGATLNHLRHSSDVLTQDYILAKRYLLSVDEMYDTILDIEAQQNFIDECLTKLKN